MSDFRPTRTCPHRLCRPLHFTAAVAGLVVLISLGPVQPWLIGLSLVGLLFSIGIYQLVHRQTMVDTVREEVAKTATITVRSGWARAAAAMDALFAMVFLFMCVSIFQTRLDQAWEPPASNTGWMTSVGGGVALTLLFEVLHRRAVRITPATEGSKS
ncbi:hypothetical protein [Streptomyces sp. NPDC060001]|uniref:hypothetical protein n=1 Tax=Streptomyces sp. NPDC060001 TaxID=3347032 RepID=UPI0036A5EB5D